MSHMERLEHIRYVNQSDFETVIAYWKEHVKGRSHYRGRGIFGTQLVKPVDRRPVTESGVRRLENLRLLGDAVFMELPMWARLLHWKAGAPPEDDDAPYQAHVLLHTIGNEVHAEVVGDTNFLGGTCDCCSGGKVTPKAWASLQINSTRV